MKVAIIGAGASGIICALKASEKHEVILLEKNDKIGKKILVTGNGKCNLWNLNLLKKDCNLIDYYNTDNYEVLKNIFKYNDKTYQYLTSDLGIFVRDKDNYVYPYSQSAQSIRETLEKQILKNKKIDLITNYEVTKIEKDNNTFKVYSKDEYISADKIIIACGYKSSNLGTNSLENLINSEITINKTYPALVPITIDSKYTKKWNGIRTNVELSLLINNEVIKKDIGEIQLTDYGISGIVSLNLSALVNKNINNNIELEINFMPDINFELYLKILKYDNNTTIEEVFETIFNYKLLFVILEEANINKNTLWNELTDADKTNLINVIHHFKIKPTGTLDYERSQVTTGGISLNEIDSNMMLIKNEGVYVSGEVLDIDGICGGYNLASSFITGYIIGENI